MTPERLTIDSARDFRLWLTAWDAGAATAWRTVADLVRAGVPRESLAFVIESMHAEACSRGGEGDGVAGG